MTITHQMLDELSLAELRSLNKQVVNLIRWKQQMETVDVKSRLAQGMTVSVNHPELRNMKLLVHKINRKNAVLKIGSHTYSVPMNLIQII